MIIIQNEADENNFYINIVREKKTALPMYKIPKYVIQFETYVIILKFIALIIIW